MKHGLLLLLCTTAVYADGLVDYNDTNNNNLEVDFEDLGNLETDIIDHKDYERDFHVGIDYYRKKEFQHALDYFISANQKNDRSPQVHYNMGLAYEELGQDDNAIEAYKRSIDLKHNMPKTHMQLAKQYKKRGLIDLALTHFKFALEQDPKLPDIASIVAQLYAEKEDFHGALPYYKIAAEQRPDDIVRNFQYANTLNTCNYTQEALQLYYKLLEKRPNDSGLLYNTAYTLKKLGRIQDAMPYYDAALTRNPDHSEAHFSLGLAYLITGQFKKGWEEYEWRWHRNSQLKPRDFKQPMWDGSRLDNKILFVHAEQGLGDTFQFIRLVKVVKEQYGGRVVVAVQSPLETVIKKCCPYIDLTITLDKMPANFDYHIPLLSLPKALGIEEHAVPTPIPYIQPDPTITEMWRRKLANDHKFKVGLCWQGNNKYSTPFLRAVVAAKSIKLNQFTPLSNVKGVSFYSLQKQNGEDQLKNLPFELITFDSDFDNSRGRFMDTAGLLSNLDLVITIDTSIAHIAAAVGTPVWIMIPEPPDWRWMLKRSDTPWYPNMRLFRQPEQGDWDAVVQHLAHELEQVVHHNAPKIDTKKASTLEKQEACTKQACTMKPKPMYRDTPKIEQAEPSSMHSSLQQELQSVEKQLTALTATIKTMDINDPEMTKSMRKCYMLSQLRDDIKDKLSVFEGGA